MSISIDNLTWDQGYFVGIRHAMGLLEDELHYIAHDYDIPNTIEHCIDVLQGELTGLLEDDEDES
jgi:hypothetical protein